MKKVAIQGIKGAFHQEAAIKYFGNDILIDSNPDFKSLVHSVESGNAHYGVIAIENTISGTINQNLKLIADKDVTICGEQKIRIIQNLGALKGTKLNDLKEVRSHYMAINQCRDFFVKYPGIKLTDASDTALGAKSIADNNLHNVGAIASKHAIDQYGLQILEESIESDKLNYTRFYIIKKSDNKIVNEKGNKITIQLVLSHDVGSLANLLNGFQALNISLTKIESSTIVGSPWKYQFFIEVELNDLSTYDDMLDWVSKQTVRSQILGRYQSCKSL